MSYLDTLLQRNGEFADQSFNPNLKMMPTSKSIIIGCVDPRVDPADIFKLEPGEAAVLRNVGGRVNPSAIETIKLLQSVTRAIGGGRGGPEANIVVLHHTDCGIKHCHHHAPDLLAQHMGVSSDELDAQAVIDPYEAVALDVAALKANPDIAGGRTVSGLVYDVATGRVELVVPPTIVPALEA